jgi:type II secretory pathway component GspD/PulD (secretin)
LDRYEDVGISLRVLPQVWGENSELINMIIHPSVTSYTQTVKITTGSGATLAEYPIINSREAETQLMLKDGETIVMGGLFKDVKSEEEIGIPFLRKIPWIGQIFSRKTNDIQKIDLLIFITAKIVKPGEIIPQEILNTASFDKEAEKIRDK